MYTETDKSLYGAAARSVLAAMARLVATGKVTSSTSDLSLDTDYQLA
jgi:hypothetical protein